MGKLSSTGWRKITAPGRHSDGNGLVLDVSPSGARSWILRVQFGGRRRDIGLGSAKDISLSEARTKAAELRAKARAGIDVVAERKQARNTVPTFEQAARIVHRELGPTWKNAKHRAQWLSTLVEYAVPAFGNQSVAEVESGHILNALAPIWLTKPETARRVRQRIASVLDWAHARGYRPTGAPSVAILSKGLPRQPRKNGHFAAMPWREIPDFMLRLREVETWSRLALEFAILTAARSGEVRGALWNEIDLVAKTWTIPAERMKAGVEHVVPLSDAALDCIGRARALSTGNLLFPGRRLDRAQSDMTLTKLLRDMRADGAFSGEATVHGFRSALRDWVPENTSFDQELVHRALAHTIEDKTDRAYRRGTSLEKRRKLMTAWARYCCKKLTNPETDGGPNAS